MLPVILFSLACVLFFLSRKKDFFAFPAIACLLAGLVITLFSMVGPKSRAGPTAHCSALGEILAKEIAKIGPGNILVLQNPHYAKAGSPEGEAERKGVRRGLGKGQSPVFTAWSPGRVETEIEADRVEAIELKPLIEEQEADSKENELIAILSLVPIAESITTRQLADWPPIYSYESSFRPQFKSLLKSDRFAAIAAGKAKPIRGQVSGSIQEIFDARFDLHLP